MPPRRPLGRLLICFGPGVSDNNLLHQHIGRFRGPTFQVSARYPAFYARGNDESDPFSSGLFGTAVKSLLSNHIVVLGDASFEDPRRRKKVEQAFRRTFPGLVVDHVRVANDDDDFAEVDDGIVIDPDVYEEGDYASNESITVESDADEYVMRGALHQASARMATVGDDGREYTGLQVSYVREGMSASDEPGDSVYTPNYISSVTLDENGNPGFYVDCKGAIEEPMAETFRRILVEEFRKQGIRSAHVRVRPDREIL